MPSKDRSSSPAKSKTPLIIGGIIGGSVLIGLFCCVCPVGLYFLLGLGARKQQQELAKDVEEQLPMKVAAEELIREYTDNEPRAKKTYTGKVVQVEGIVARIVEGRVELKSGKRADFWTVDCYFDDRNAMPSVSKGSSVRVKGICEGRDSIDARINIRKCKLVN